MSADDNDYYASAEIMIRASKDYGYHPGKYMYVQISKFCDLGAKITEIIAPACRRAVVITYILQLFYWSMV